MIWYILSNFQRNCEHDKEISTKLQLFFIAKSFAFICEWINHFQDATQNRKNKVKITFLNDL